MEKVIKKSLHKLINKKSNDKLDKNISDSYFIDRIKFIHQSNSYNGKIKYISKINCDTYLSMSNNLPLEDVSKLTKKSFEKIKNNQDEKIAIFIEHKSTSAIFVKLFDMPSKESWLDSEIKNMLYSEGITTDSIDDLIGLEKSINNKASNHNNSISLKEKLEFIYQSDNKLLPLISVFLFWFMLITLYNIFISLIIMLPLLLYISMLYISIYKNEVIYDKN